MNQENYNNFKSPDIVTVINGHRFEWLGHVVRVYGTRTVKKLLEGKPGGEGKRPRLGWMDDVESNLSNMCIKRWKSRLDKTECVCLLREVKTRFRGPLF
jgi:hypothetical protein